MNTGSCLCGAVRFVIDGPLGQVDACHCTQCRKQSGHYWSAAEVADANLTVTEDGALKWFASSDKIRRGFCRHCGSGLFWKPLHRGWTSVAMGSIDGATGVKLMRHIFVADKGDYYDIADDLPQNPQ